MVRNERHSDCFTPKLNLWKNSIIFLLRRAEGRNKINPLQLHYNLLFQNTAMTTKNLEIFTKIINETLTLINGPPHASYHLLARSRLDGHAFFLIIALLLMTSFERHLNNDILHMTLVRSIFFKVRQFS